MQIHAVADLEASDHVEQPLQRDALGVEQEFGGRGALGVVVVASVPDREDAQVAEHLALVG